MASTRITCPETLDRDTGKALLSDVERHAISKGDTITLDFAGTRSMDALGGAWLVKVADAIRLRDGDFRFEGHGGAVAEFLDFIEPGLHGVGTTKRRGEGPFERLGELVIAVTSEARDALNLSVDAIYWTFVGPLEGNGFRWGLLLDEMHEMGVRAVRINGLMNFLLGLIIAMLSAAQLAQFGVGIYVADLTMIAFARELAAIMTAVVVSARTGAAIAAELATMKVQEEIDALKGMGLNVAQFLVAPRVLAMLIVMPCLTALGMVAGILGGSIWGIFVLEIRPDQWFQQTLGSAYFSDIIQGLLKSVVFAVIIALVGCHNGLRVEGGSRGVGLMTTRAVVMDIFFIVLVDMVFAVLFYYVL